jgi:site-specific DNA-methyltransferase (adenine-specific)
MLSTMKLLHGDCLEVMKTLPDKSIDCFICDLPYGCLTAQTYKGVIDKSGSDLGKTYGEKITWDIKLNLELFWEQVKRLAKNDHTPVLMFCTAKFGFELYNSNPDWFRYDLVWSKPTGVGFLSANKMPLRSHENIYVFSKKGANYKRVDVEVEGAREWKQFGKVEASGVYGLVRDKPVIRPVGTISSKEGIRCVKSVVEISAKRGKGNHPTQKPAELYEWLLKRYCPEGGTVLDPTAGSFTSCFVAKKLGLNAIGIEKDEVFYNKALAKTDETKGSEND